MKQAWIRGTWAVAALVATGCASVPRDAGVLEMQRMVQEHSRAVAAGRATAACADSLRAFPGSRGARALPIMTGVDQSGVAEKLEELIPGYMPMGDTGMGDMMDMGKPRNTLLMGDGEGPFGEIFMGGMFTILKIREGLRSYHEDPGWYEYPASTLAMPVGERQAVAQPRTMPRRRPGAARWVPPGGANSFNAVRGGGHGSHRR